jgi:hypothetical protein
MSSTKKVVIYKKLLLLVLSLDPITRFETGSPPLLLQAITKSKFPVRLFFNIQNLGAIPM